MAAHPDVDLERRRALLERVIADPPLVHRDAPNGAAWRTSRSCYEYLAEVARPGDVTLETGAGLSTVLFTLWGCRHTAVVPDAAEAEAIESWCDARGFDRSGLTFDLRPSEVALPDRVEDGLLDVVLLDGAHSFPLPVLDWFYGASRLRRGGVVVFDDLPLPAVAWLLADYLDLDPRWTRMAGTRKWRAYRRESEGSLAEHESAQQFFRGPTASLTGRVTGWIGTMLPKRLRRVVLPQ